MILCIGATPAAQRVMVFEKVAVDQVNRAAKTVDGIAGKAINVTKVLKLLKEAPVAIGFIGGVRGREIQSRLGERGIENEFIEVPCNTRQCITVIDRQAGTQTELVEESQPVPPEKYDELLALVRRRIRGCKAIVMSGTLTSGAPETFYRDCLKLANATGMLTILDAKGQALEQALDARPGVVKPNRAELSATTREDISHDRACLAAMKRLHLRGAKHVIVTAGKEPALAFDGKSVSRIIAPSVETLNPIGSGDSFTAALTWRLLKGDDLSQACRWATAAGAANALTLMPAEFEFSELEGLALLVKLERVPSPE
jgi:tagatose 6-phosphate kinase